MRAVFGVLSLLLALAIVAFVASKQLNSIVSPAAEAAASSANEAAAGASTPALSGTPAHQSQQLQKNVQDNLNKIMQQAPARAEPAQ